MRVHKRRAEDLPRSVYRQCCWLNFGRDQPMYKTLVEFRHRSTGRFPHKHCGPDSPPAYVHWIEGAGKVIGWSLAFVCWKRPSAKASWNYGSYGYFYVRHSHRRRGVGAALAKATERTIRHDFGNGAMSCWAHDDLAKGFFKSCAQRGLKVYA